MLASWPTPVVYCSRTIPMPKPSPLRSACCTAPQQRTTRWHLFGRHLPLDEVLALRHLRASAAQDFPDGLFWYGLCLYEGRGTAADPVAGRALIERAAAAGHYEAAEWLSESAQPTN